MESDKELVEILEIARGCGVTIHVRGTALRPVVELLSKQDRGVGNRIVVGGIELKQRYARWKKIMEGLETLKHKAKTEG